MACGRMASRWTKHPCSSHHFASSSTTALCFRTIHPPFLHVFASLPFASKGSPHMVPLALRCWQVPTWQGMSRSSLVRRAILKHGLERKWGEAEGGKSHPAEPGPPELRRAAEAARPPMATRFLTETAAAARGAEANVRCEAEMSESPMTAAGSPEAILIWSVQAGRALAHHGLAVVRALTVGSSSLLRMWGCICAKRRR